MAGGKEDAVDSTNSRSGDDSVQRIVDKHGARPQLACYSRKDLAAQTTIQYVSRQRLSGYGGNPKQCRGQSLHSRREDVHVNVSKCHWPLVGF